MSVELAQIRNKSLQRGILETKLQAVLLPSPACHGYPGVKACQCGNLNEALTETRERLPMVRPMAFRGADGLLGPVKLNVR